MDLNKSVPENIQNVLDNSSEEEVVNNMLDLMARETINYISSIENIYYRELDALKAAKPEMAEAFILAEKLLMDIVTVNVDFLTDHALNPNGPTGSN